MAIQHTKADGTQTANGDIPVVAPMNIGKGLLWDPATKTYYVAIDDRTFEVDELGRLKLRVSALEDNQLKVRDDGVYQGNKANPLTYNLFVSSVSGNDSNPGTEDLPLRTLTAAFAKNKPNEECFIYLKAGEDFVLTEDIFLSSGANKHIAVYGDPLIAIPGPIDTTRTFWSPYMRKGLNKPTIKFDAQVDPRNGKGDIFSFHPYFNSNLVFKGIAFDLNIVKSGEQKAAEVGATFTGFWSSSVIYGNKGTVMFENCDFLLSDGPLSLSLSSISSGGNTQSCDLTFVGGHIKDTRTNKSLYMFINFGVGQTITIHNRLHAEEEQMFANWGLAGQADVSDEILNFIKAGNHNGLAMEETNTQYPLYVTSNVKLTP